MGGSKIYEDLDENIKPISSQENLYPLAPYEKLSSPEKHNQEQQKEDIGKVRKQENGEQQKEITQDREGKHPSKDEMKGEMGEKDKKPEGIMIKGSETEQDAMHTKHRKNGSRKDGERREGKKEIGERRKRKK